MDSTAPPSTLRQRRRGPPLLMEDRVKQEGNEVDPLVSSISDWRTTTSERSAFVPIFRPRTTTTTPPTKTSNDAQLLPPPVQQEQPPVLLTISTSSSSCSNSAAIGSPTGDIGRHLLLPTSPTTPPPLLRKPASTASQRQILSPFDNAFHSSPDAGADNVNMKGAERISSPNPKLAQGQQSTRPKPRSPKQKSSLIDWKRLNLGLSLITSAHMIGFLWAFYVHECEEEKRTSVLANSMMSYLWPLAAGTSDDSSVKNSKKLFLPLQLCGSTWIWMVLAVYPFFLNTTTNQPEYRTEHSAAWIPLKFNYVLLHLYSLKSMAWLLLDAALAYFREQHILRQTAEKLGGLILDRGHSAMTNNLGSWIPMEANKRENEEEFVLHALLVYGVTSWIWTSLLSLPMLISVASITSHCRTQPISIAATTGDSEQKPSISTSNEKRVMFEEGDEPVETNVEEEEDYHDYTWILCTLGFTVFLCGFFVQLWLEMKTFRSTQDYHAAMHNSLSPCWLLHNCQEPISLTHANSQHLLDKGEVLIWAGAFLLHSPRLWLLPRPRARQVKPLVYATMAVLTATGLAFVARHNRLLEIPNLLMDFQPNPDDGSRAKESIYAILVKAALTRHDVFMSELRSFEI